MSESQSHIDGGVSLSETSDDISLPEPIPTATTVRSGVDDDVFVTLRPMDDEAIVHLLRESDAETLGRQLLSVIDTDEYAVRRQDYVSVDQVERDGDNLYYPRPYTPDQNKRYVDDDESVEDDNELPLDSQETHRVLSELPDEPDLHPIRDWLLGDRDGKPLSYQHWIHMLQQSSLCIRWESDSRANPGYATWVTTHTSDNTSEQINECGELKVCLSTKTTATGERAVSVMADVVNADSKQILPTVASETPFEH